MPQDPPRPLTLAPPTVARGTAQASWTERVMLHAWILAITVALLWALLS